MFEEVRVAACVLLLSGGLLGQDEFRILTVGDVKLKDVAGSVGGSPRTILEVVVEATKTRRVGLAVVLRAGGERIEILHVDLKVIVRTGDNSLNIRLKPDDVVFICYRPGTEPAEVEVLDAALGAALPKVVREKVWQHIARAISNAKPPSTSIGHRLLFINRHELTNVRVQHLHEIGGMGVAARAAVPGLIDVLDVGGRVTAEAVSALGRIGPAAAAARRRLRLLAKGKDSRVAKQVEQALLAIGNAPLPPWVERGVTGRALRAAKAIDSGKMRWHYTCFVNYKTRYRELPRGTGVKFLIDPWIRNVVEHTPQNRDRYFSAAFRTDPQYAKIAKIAVEKLWPSRDRLTASDSSFYAVRADGKRMSGKSALMCSPMYSDGTVNVLYGDGTVKLLVIPEEQRAKWTPAELGLTK